MHAEAMLLVDDRQAEPLELDALLKQRMRADRDLARAPEARSASARVRAAAAALAGQQRQRQVERREPASRNCARAARPAIRSAPSPRPESRLPTARTAASAATTVLPQPTSPCTSRSIGLDCARSRSISLPRAQLRAGQSERQRLPESVRPASRVAGSERPARIALNLAAQAVAGSADARAAPRTRDVAAPDDDRWRAAPGPRPAAADARNRALRAAAADSAAASIAAAASRARARCASSRSAMLGQLPQASLLHAFGQRIDRRQRLFGRVARRRPTRRYSGCTISRPLGPRRISPKQRRRVPRASALLLRAEK